MELRLSGKVALVSGATGGIGKAIVAALAYEGVDVALLSRHTAVAKAIVNELSELVPKRQIVIVEANLASTKEVQDAVDAIAHQLGGIDIVVNVAGGSKRGFLEEVPEEEWYSCFHVKPFGMISVCRATLPYLEKSSAGRIINIGGIHGREPKPWSVMGSTINAGVLGFSKALSLGLAPKGITVNVVNPGFTATRRWTALIERTSKEQKIDINEAERRLEAQVPLGRVAQPEEIADAVLFLASERAEMITGCSINVDGGRSQSI